MGAPRGVCTSLKVALRHWDLGKAGLEVFSFPTVSSRLLPLPWSLGVLITLRVDVEILSLLSHLLSSLEKIPRGL